MNAWLICPNAQKPAKLRLFCFPYAGGGSAVFRNWGRDLGPSVEVCCVQLPGRENRLAERPYNSMGALIPPLVEAMRTSLDLPYAFYGHSLGARVAFETARALRRQGAAQPVHLFAAASPAPQIPWPYPRMRMMGESQFLAEIQRRYGGVPRIVVEDAELRALLVPGLRADINLLETYTYEEDRPLQCGITVIGGGADRIVTREYLEPWRQQTLSACALHMLDGDHFFLQSDRARLLALISEQLAVTSEQLAVSSSGWTNRTSPS